MPETTFFHELPLLYWSSSFRTTGVVMSPVMWTVWPVSTAAGATVGAGALVTAVAVDAPDTTRMGEAIIAMAMTIVGGRRIGSSGSRTSQRLAIRTLSAVLRHVLELPNVTSSPTDTLPVASGMIRMPNQVLPSHLR